MSISSHRQFHGIILIDVWVSGNPVVNRFYHELCEFLSAFVQSKHVILPNYGYGPTDPRFQHLGRISNIDCWADFQNLGYDQGDWLLGGQSWGMCTHDRDLALLPALNHGLESRLFSHPKLMLHILDHHTPKVTDIDFEQDPSVKWQRQQDGYWLAQKLPGPETT